MGYQALLFCPDEKTARAVTQVLSELDFSVEPCTEPFAAVKKLMAQRFDAVVVDCDNEQNATLLFKSARNSASNQSSLAVAVVEGQAGVAKAFRIGANLVLTKPINIEQAKGTLRVARGLLRKGGDPTKPAAASPVSAPAAVPAPKAASPVASAPRPAAPVAPAAKPAIPVPAASATAKPSPVASNAKSSTYLDAAELMGESTKASDASAPANAPAKKSYPWQPAKPGAEPMASAMRKAAEAAGMSDAAPAKSLEVPASKPADKPVITTVAATSTGAASAPAPAKEKIADVPLITPAEKHKVSFDEKSAIAEVSAKAQESAASEPEPPSFSMGAPAFDEEEPANNKKALLIVAGVVVLAALAGFLGWKNMSGKSAPAAATPAAAAASPSTGSATPSTEDNKSAEENAPSSVSSAPSHADASPAAAASKPSAASKTAAHEAAPAKKEPVAEDTTTTISPSAPAIVVKNESKHQAAKTAAADSDQPVAPSAIGVASATDTKALAEISSAPVSVPRASSDVVKISQGVSEGLVLKRVAPRYPPQALQMRKEGAVQMQATVTKDGNIANIKVLSGDATLARAAEEAVRQWKYKPYYLNGEPVDIQTQITVNFKLPR